MSFDLDGFINLHTPAKTLEKGDKAMYKLEYDFLYLSSEMGFKRCPQIENFHHPYCN